MQNSAKISVVLGSYNRLDFLKLTIESTRKELSSLEGEIVVVDGGSDDGTLQWLVAQKDIITIVQHNKGEWKGKEIKRRSWGYFMNLGFKAASGKYICMLSDDCLVVPGALKNGLQLFEKKLAQNEKIGALAFYWRNWPEQVEYNVGRTLGHKMFVNHGMYLKEAMEKVGYVEEETYAFYHADGDLCLKMWQAGYACIDSPDSYIEHYSHANLAHRQVNVEKQKKDWATYLSRWEGIFYDRKLDNIGDWVVKNFTDKTGTCKLFEALHQKAESQKKVIRIKSKIRKLLP